MRVICPSCHAAFSLDVAIQMDASRAALLQALRMPAPLAGLWAQYLGMFRSKSRALAHDRADKLMRELLPMLDNQTVTRNGLTRPATLDIWREALEQMVELRNADKLTLPLKTHGYLLEIVFSAADRHEARAERKVEDTRKRGEHRQQTDAQLDRSNHMNRIRSDYRLGLINREQAVDQLADLGYPEELIDA